MGGGAEGGGDDGVFAAAAAATSSSGGSVSSPETGAGCDSLRERGEPATVLGPAAGGDDVVEALPGRDAVFVTGAARSPEPSLAMVGADALGP
jgi:hypothetical protein